MKIEDIRKNIVGEYCIANSNRYQISFLPKTGAGSLGEALGYSPTEEPVSMDKKYAGDPNTQRTQKISFLADEIQVPGFSVATGDLRGAVPGINMKYAHTKSFPECQITFMMDYNHTPYKAIQKWGEFIFQHDEGNDIAASRGRASPDSFIRTNYYDDYTADLIIDKIETNDQVVSRYRLVNAFPYTVSSMTYSNGPNQPVKFMANFYFEVMREEFGTSGTLRKGVDKTQSQTTESSSTDGWRDISFEEYANARGLEIRRNGVVTNDPYSDPWAKF